MQFTAIMKDFSKHQFGETRVLVVEGSDAQDAASIADITLAGEIFERWYPGEDPIDGGHDEAWIRVQDRCGTVAIIAGTPRVWFEDAVHEADRPDFIVN